MLSRREALQIGAISAVSPLAGCSSDNRATNTRTGTSTNSPTPEKTVTAEPTPESTAESGNEVENTPTETKTPLEPATRIESINDPPSALGLEISAEILDGNLQAETPAIIQTVVENTTDQKVSVFPEFEEPNAWDCKAAPAGLGLVLVPKRLSAIRETDTCWAYSEIDYPKNQGSGAGKGTTFAPGELITNKWELWWDAGVETDNCIPTGTYTFERKLEHGENIPPMRVVLELVS